MQHISEVLKDVVLVTSIRYLISFWNTNKDIDVEVKGIIIGELSKFDYTDLTVERLREIVNDELLHKLKSYNEIKANEIVDKLLSLGLTVST